MKVTMIMGVMGACRANELYNMKIQDIGSAVLVNVPNTTAKISKKFTINEDFYRICKKYIELHPAHVTSNYFFLNYQNGKCTSQRIDINKFTIMGKQIAEFLKLLNCNEYYEHSFRRSSATILVDAGGDIRTLKRHGGWKSTMVAEGYIEDSMKNKLDTAQKISTSIQEETTEFQIGNLKQIGTTDQSIDLSINSMPSFIFNNCSFNICYDS
ncbi:uncharacterized protein LOC123313576 [Coccinella septempunctata]|uniref:uncharacterized protein LOC123313576 n=1 Tax=Coccinella septempunctata TaxID=41139 RepID=UPI001D05F438|nr:uncharacterized protein LOC123313576 [Coccinella septempunctata]